MGTKGQKGYKRAEGREKDSGREAGVVSEGRTVNGAGEGRRGMLTGKERCLRGARYFLSVFGVGVAFQTFFFSVATFPPGADRLPMFLFFVVLFCFVPALVVGLGIMACRERKRWHWVAWGGIAVLVALVVATLG